MSEPLLDYLLAGPGEVRQIGPERGPRVATGITRYDSTRPTGSYRYVAYDDSTPTGVLQVIAVSGGHVIANVFVRPDARRRGVASALLRRAESDLGPLSWPPEDEMSGAGVAWRKRVAKNAPPMGRVCSGCATPRGVLAFEGAYWHPACFRRASAEDRAAAREETSSAQRGEIEQIDEERRQRKAVRSNPLPIDNDVATGIGAVGYNQDVDYFGLRVLMRPSVFHRLTLELPREEARSVEWMKEQIRAGRRFGAPILYLEVSPDWTDDDFSKPAIVHGHEGRNRMYASMELYGDEPVETHVFPRGVRNRHLTSGWVNRINSGLVSERHSRWGDNSGHETRGPLFEKVLNAQSGRTEGWRGGPERNPKLVGNRGVPMRRVQEAFNACFDIVATQFPDIGDIELHEDERAGADNGSGSERQFGYCKDGDTIVIAFAAKTEKLPAVNLAGLMAHEFGHALDYRYGDKLGKMLGARLPEGVERRADAIANAVFGTTIQYDDHDVQCIDCDGVAPRPRRLGA